MKITDCHGCSVQVSIFREDKVRIGAVSFHDDARLEFNLQQYKSKENVQQVRLPIHSVPVREALSF